MSKLDKYSDNLNSSSGMGGVKYGLANFRILAINPNQDQLFSIIGDSAEKFDTTYPKVDGYDGKPVRPVMVWLQDAKNEMSPQLLNLSVGVHEKTNQNGDPSQVINDNVQFSYGTVASVTSNNNMSWFDKSTIRQAKQGEVEYYDFMKKLLAWSDKSETSFVAMMKDIGADINSVFDGNFEGLKEIEGHATSKGNMITDMVVVREIEGDEGTIFRQQLLGKPAVWSRAFSDEVSAGTINRIKKYDEKQTNAGYSLSNHHYICDDLTDFDMSKAGSSDAPSATVSSAATESVSAEADDDLPF